MSTGAGSENPLLRVEGVSKSFGGVQANRDISISVAGGAVHGLIGPNGSGKTTLFNGIAGAHPVDRGTVTFAGVHVERLRVPRISRLGLVRTFQQTHVYGGMSCLQNMQISAPQRGGGRNGGGRDGRDGGHGDGGGRARGGDRRAARGGGLFGRVPAAATERAESLLEFVGLYGLRGQPAASLSFGQQKLLEFAMALMCEPKMLLLDEPTAGINPTLINGMIDRLLRANAELGITLLVIEHNMRVIMNLATHLYCLAHGRLLAEGPPERVRNDPRVVDAYLGAAS